MKQYYLMDIERTANSNLLVWWKPNNHGYTTNLDEAGKYDEDTILKDRDYYCGKDTQIVACEDVDKVAQRCVTKDIIFSSYLKC